MVGNTTLKYCELGKRLEKIPILAKQMIVLVTLELIVVGFLVSLGSWLINTSLTAQSQSQAESELQVLDVSYNIKLNPMGFGFRVDTPLA